MLVQPSLNQPITKLAAGSLLSGCASLYAGEEHYNCISALHKAMRGSDQNASLYWLARMLEGGEDPLYVARRLVRFASEDIGECDWGSQSPSSCWEWGRWHKGGNVTSFGLRMSWNHVEQAREDKTFYRNLGVYFFVCVCAFECIKKSPFSISSLEMFFWIWVVIQSIEIKEILFNLLLQPGVEVFVGQFLR